MTRLERDEHSKICESVWKEVSNAGKGSESIYKFINTMGELYKDSEERAFSALLNDEIPGAVFCMSFLETYLHLSALRTMLNNRLEFMDKLKEDMQINELARIAKQDLHMKVQKANLIKFFPELESVNQ